MPMTGAGVNIAVTPAGSDIPCRNKVTWKSIQEKERWFQWTKDRSDEGQEAGNN